MEGEAVDIFARAILEGLRDRAGVPGELDQDQSHLRISEFASIIEEARTAVIESGEK